MLKIEEIMEKLQERGIIKRQGKYRRFSGGTSSTVGTIEYDGRPLYVVKINEPEVLAAETEFLSMYQGEALFPDVCYVDADYRYIVYKYIPGQMSGRRESKRVWLSFLARNVMNSYRYMVNQNVWGWIEDAQPSWSSFLALRVTEARDVLNTYLDEEDHEFIYTLAVTSGRVKSENRPYLIHGDFGVHNFLFEGGQIVGVIDPTPVAGPPIYDLVYAFCSSPDDLYVEVIQPAASLLYSWHPHNETDLYEEVLLGLYCRMDTCIRRHPEDLLHYLSAWRRWKRDYHEMKASCER